MGFWCRMCVSLTILRTRFGGTCASIYRFGRLGDAAVWRGTHTWLDVDDWALEGSVESGRHGEQDLVVSEIATCGRGLAGLCALPDEQDLLAKRSGT